MLSRKRDFIKIDDFQLSNFSVTLVSLSIKIDGFGFVFHKISLYVIVKASRNITNAMVIWKRLYQKNCSFWYDCKYQYLQTYLTIITNEI